MDCCEILNPATRPFDFLFLLGTGLTISLGHCLGMCGPLVTAFSVSQKQISGPQSPLWLRLLTYHTGRITSYVIIGAVLGLLGSTVFLTGEGRQIQGGLSLAVGLFMLLLAVGLLGWLPVSRWVESGPWQRAVAGRIQGLLGARTTPGRWSLGLANGFLPCGPVFATALTAAAAGSIWKGALGMLAFGLGTVPALLIVGLGVGQLSVRWRSFFNRLGAMLIIAIAVQLILRGLAAWGVVGHFRIGEFVVW